MIRSSVYSVFDCYMSVSVAANGIKVAMQGLGVSARNIATSDAIGKIKETFTMVSQGRFGGVLGTTNVRDDVVELQYDSTERVGDFVVPNESRIFVPFTKTDGGKEFVFARTASLDMDHNGTLRYQGKAIQGFELDSSGKPIGGTSFADLKPIIIDRNSLSPAEAVSKVDINFRFDSSEAPLPTCGYQIRSDIFTSDPNVLSGKSILVTSIKEKEGGPVVQRGEFIFSGFKVASSGYTVTDMAKGTALLEVNGVTITLQEAISTSGSNPDNDVSAMNKIISSINGSTLLNASIMDDGTNKKFFIGTDSQQSVAISNLVADLGFTANFSIDAAPPGKFRFSSVSGLEKLLSGVGVNAILKNKGLLKIQPDRGTSVSITNSSTSSDVLSLFSLNKSDQGFINIAYSSADQRYALKAGDAGVMSQTAVVINPEGGKAVITVLSKKIGVDKYIAEVAVVGPSQKTIVQAGVIEMGQDGQVSSISKVPNDIFARTGVKFSNEAFPINVDTPPGTISINGQTLTHGLADDMAAKTFATPQGFAKLVEQATDIKTAFMSDSSGDLMIRFRSTGNYTFSDNKGGAMMAKLGMPQPSDIKAVDVLAKDGGTNVDWDSITSIVKSTNVAFNVTAEKSAGMNQKIQIVADGKSAGSYSGWHIDATGTVVIDYSNGNTRTIAGLGAVDQNNMVEGWKETGSGFYESNYGTMSLGLVSDFGLEIIVGATGGGGGNVIDDMIDANTLSNLSSAIASMLRITQDTKRGILNNVSGS